MPAQPTVCVEELGLYGELLQDHVLGQQPGAGAGFVLALDSRWYWRFRAVRLLLSTSAVVASRHVTVDYCDTEGTVWASSNAPAVQAQSVANQEYRFAPRSAVLSGVAGVSQYADLVQLWVPPAWQLRINVANIDVGDQIAGVRLYVNKLLPTDAGEH